MAAILAILKILGILLLVVLSLALFASGSLLFIPVRYVVEFRKGEPVRLGFRVSWFLRAVQLHKSISGDRIYMDLFGIDIRDLKHLFRRRKKEEEEHPVTKSRIELVDDLYDEVKRQENFQREEEKNQEVQVETDYEDHEAGEEEDGGKAEGRSKKSFSFDKISSIITFIRNYEHRSGLRKIKKELMALCRYLMPDKVRGKISFGTGDPCTTGWILGAVSMFRAAYTEGLTILPDFEEKMFEAEGYAKGKVRVIYFLRLFLRGYMDDDIKRCVYKIIKMI